MTLTPFWDESGKEHRVTRPDEEIPSWGILTPPPSIDPKTSTLVFKGGWHIHRRMLGEKYWDKDGNELTVSEEVFKLPPDHTFIAPPKCEDKQQPLLKDGVWAVVEDHRGAMAYSKENRTELDFVVDAVGSLPSTHTLDKPSRYDSWSASGWSYDKERHRPHKASKERAWRDELLTKTLDRIDQYEKDKTYPSELRTSPLSEADYLNLLRDRKNLSDYPSRQDFPFGERPTLMVTKEA
ncbi:hypothetical protein [Vibrio sp. SCSIO 43137]|uniref:hypothetical protein n=1 Tax=Vibrio sp. SCSIO 43137 TaxID=3021011 RepID=UPI0023081B61|nr:hypothetical protein [Vibrio sp. SCSIO 43137]WCE28414.1 hypothetical protein PK654_08480 [Vibrio sp. SCSIO 43137]